MNELFNSLITGVVKPLLKEYQFNKKGLNFYKSSNDLIFVINFQKSQGNSWEQIRFYINCGIYSSIIDKVIEKNEIPEPKEYDCHYRKRISDIIKSDTDNYQINRETDLKELNKKVSTDLNAVIKFFTGIQNIDDLTNLMIEENGLNNYKELFEYLLIKEDENNTKRYALKLFQRFGNEDRWNIFEKNLMDLSIKYKQETILKDIFR